jgi:hypothetical protein
MKTFVSIVSTGLLLFAPLVSDAAINSLNGLNAASQTLVATTSSASSMHMTITSAGSSHTLSWDNTTWAVKQGGTGAASFGFGQLLFGNGTNPIQATSSLSYSTSTQTLTVGSPSSLPQFKIFAANGNGGVGTTLWINSGNGGAADVAAGQMAVLGGVGTGTGGEQLGGLLDLEGGEADGNATGGLAQLVGGVGGESGGNGGDVYIMGGGVRNDAGSGGNVNFLSPCNSMGTNCGRFAFQTGSRADGVLNFAINSGLDRFYTFPDFTGTLALLENDQTWSGANTFNQGPTATTTVNFGQMGSTTSHVCFNGWRCVVLHRQWCDGC